MTWWLLIGLAISAVVAVFALVRLWESRKWTHVDGRIIRAQIHTITVPRKVIVLTEQFNTRHELQLEYEYVVGGVRHIGGRILASGPNVFDDEADARRMMERYPAGASVTVYHSTDDPELSCLVPGTAVPIFAYLGIALMLLLGIVIATLAVLVVTGKISATEFLEKIRIGGGT